jgi:uncharacterized protein (DUF111 family)
MGTADRWKRPRDFVTVTTRYGPVRVKRGWEGDRLAILTPEYDDCRRLALSVGVSVQVVHDEARAAARLLPPMPRQDDPADKTQADLTPNERETGE